MALTKLPKNAITDGAIDSDKIEDGTIQAVELSGTLPEEKLATGTIENAKLSNSTITINGTSVSLGGSATVGVEVNWQSVITADGSTATTGVAGNGYMIDTTSAAHTINLPASATLGDQIAIKDYAGTFASNNLTIGRNGHNIQGVANDSLINTNRASLLLVYVDSTKGWIYAKESNVSQLYSFISATGGTVTESGDYKIHTFTGDGCFVVSNVGTGGGLVDYLVVAGGGGGGGDMSGGGGAGGYRFSNGTASGCYTAGPSPLGASALAVSATTYPITVGGGGAAGSPSPANGSRGSNSVFSTITSTGGGGGLVRAGNMASPVPAVGPGGSGGGTSYEQPANGVGNTPPVSPPQGNPGSPSPGSPPFQDNAGGGGGGAGAAAVTATDGNGVPGGAGLTSCITASPITRAGGGGGGYFACIGGTSGGSGGSGGGGAGGGPSPSNGTAGTANTGGGGGGGAAGVTSGAAGGKGIVIIRYKFQ